MPAFDHRRETMRKTALHLLTLLLALAPMAALAERHFPEQAKRGEMKAFQYPYIKIGDRKLHVSPSSRIFNEQNMIIMPVAVPRRNAPVMFTIDMNGDLGDIWLLSAEEAKARPLPVIAPPAGGT